MVVIKIFEDLSLGVREKEINTVAYEKTLPKPFR
jgi:hypothetical protein